jgi:CCT motif
MWLQMFGMGLGWLDRLGTGRETLPAGFLDSLIPDDPPKPQVAPPSDSSARAAAVPLCPTDTTHLRPPQAAAAADLARRRPVAPVALQPQVMEVPQRGPTLAGCQVMHVDPDTYVPRSLVPMEAALRSAAINERRGAAARFREKKRSRQNCTKKIRYASRKAYAEVRPRIKGRFARKDEVAAMRAAGILPAA